MNTCIRCGYYSNCISDVKRHLKKKKECLPILTDSSREECLNILKLKKIDYKDKIIDIFKKELLKNTKNNITNEIEEYKNEIQELKKRLLIKEQEISELSSDNIVDKTSGHIYMILEREFISNSDIKVVKIGRTINLKSRMKQYPKGSSILYSTTCKNILESEKELINIFKNTFEHRHDFGKEYFKGNVKDMITELHKYFLKNV